MKPSVVLLHIGDSYINYVNDCIEQLMKFNNCDVYLIISQKHFKHITSNIHLVAIENIKKTQNHLRFIESSKRNREFRGGFWNFVVERFYYIEDLMAEYQLTDVFNIENDIMIYCDLGRVASILNDNSIRAAAPFDNDFRCIPSIVYFKDVQVLSSLNHFMLQYENLNEQVLISMFNEENSLIDNFPLIPPGYNKPLISKTGLTAKDPSKFYQHFDKFNSVFDAAAIGQYLGGIDERNIKNKFVSKVFRKIFKNTHWFNIDKAVNKVSIIIEELQKSLLMKPKRFINERAVYDVSNFTYVWEKDNQGRNIPYLLFDRQKIKINNLHIHSKQLKNFK